MKEDRSRRTRPLAVLLMAGLVAACVAPSGSPAPSSSPSETPAISPSPSPSSTPSPSPTPSAAPSPSGSSALPDFPYIWIIVLENQDYGRIVGAADLPYLNGLIDRYGLAEHYNAVARPSQPNYLALFSGSTQDIHDNDDHNIDAPTVADQIEASGRTWREYAENRPLDCFDGALADGGRDGPGVYRRKHAPAISFDSIRGDPARCANLVDLLAFQPGDANYSFIVPNQCHSAHDCKITQADTWLAGFAPKILDSDVFKAGGLLVVTFDEGGGSDPGGGHIATIVISPDVPAGFRADTPYDHYSLLRTVEDAWGLGCLADACAAQPMTEFFDGA